MHTLHITVIQTIVFNISRNDKNMHTLHITVIQTIVVPKVTCTVNVCYWKLHPKVLETCFLLWNSSETELKHFGGSNFWNGACGM